MLVIIDGLPYFIPDSKGDLYGTDFGSSGGGSGGNGPSGGDPDWMAICVTCMAVLVAAFFGFVIWDVWIR